MTKSRTIASYLTQPRWTPDDARAALAAHSASGLTVVAFAAAEGLDPQRLYGWRRRFATDVATVPRPRFAAKEGTVPRPTFVEVRARAGDGIEVVLRGGDILRIPSSFESETLTRLLKVLEPSRSC
jgi:transposase-like protein